MGGNMVIHEAIPHYYFRNLPRRLVQFTQTKFYLTEKSRKLWRHSEYEPTPPHYYCTQLVNIYYNYFISMLCISKIHCIFWWIKFLMKEHNTTGSSSQHVLVTWWPWKIEFRYNYLWIWQISLAKIYMLLL